MINLVSEPMDIITSSERIEPSFLGSIHFNLTPIFSLRKCHGTILSDVQQSIIIFHHVFKLYRAQEYATKFIPSVVPDVKIISLSSLAPKRNFYLISIMEERVKNYRLPNR